MRHGHGSDDERDSTSRGPVDGAFAGDGRPGKRRHHGDRGFQRAPIAVTPEDELLSIVLEQAKKDIRPMLFFCK